MPLELWAAYCPSCATTVVEETAYQPRADDGALVHARTTGHAVDVIRVPDWVVVYVVPGSPGLPFGAAEAGDEAP